MKRQSIWIFVILMIFLGAGLCEAVESASRYKTMYGSTGYKNVHNPNSWTVPSSKLHLGTNTPGSRLFRYYIPPAVSGTVSLALFVPQSQMIGAVVRLGFPPQCDSYSTSTSVSESSFYGLPWDERDATLAQLRANDMRIRNYTGTISLVTDEAFSSSGEWLYVKVIFDGNGSHIYKTNFEVGIDAVAYSYWYDNTAIWDRDGNPLPNGQIPSAIGRCDNFSPAGGSDDPPAPPVDDPFAPGFPIFPPIEPPVPPAPPPIEEESYISDSSWPLYIGDMECKGSIIEFVPVLSFKTLLTGKVECYAGYARNGKFYIAQLGLDGQIFFERYITGDKISSYDTFNFNKNDLWKCKAFQNENLMDNMLDQVGITFYCGVGVVGNLDNIQGASFEFKCSLIK